MTEHAFQTEVTELLRLVTHHLYSEREIFLRELISNASDACDKLRFEALTNADLTKGDETYQVRLTTDEEAKTLTITDNGIGLSEADAIEHLGTIAKSGTRAFVEKLKESNQGDEAQGLIGQFGVGFYSAFIVADKVVVESRKAGDSSDAGVRWESTGDGNFVTETIARPQRGTSITLHLKEDAADYAKPWKLRELVKKHSDFVAYPVMMPKVLTEEEEKEGKAAEDEQINTSTALWTRSKDDITDEQYTEFYRSLGGMVFDEPATRLHFTVEGQLEFTALLFIPSQPPMDMFDQGKRGLSLYVRRVFITDECTDLLPEYLRFVRGVVDSSDLPLNVSRELLQQEAVVQKLRKIITKRVLDHLDRLARSEDEADQKAFASFTAAFGSTAREGIANDQENKERLLKIARWRSTHTVEQDVAQEEAPETPSTTGLAAYKERMQEGQESIYVLPAAGFEAAQASPHLEAYKAKNYEVLFLTDAVDDWLMDFRALEEFDGTKIVHIARGGDNLQDDASKEALEKQSEEWKDFLGFAGEKLDGIKEVRLSKRLTDSPACLINDEFGMSPQMVAMRRRMGQEVPEQERILELNPDHELVQRLYSRYGDDQASSETWLNVLHDQATLAEGGAVKDGAATAKRLQDLLAQVL